MESEPSAWIADQAWVTGDGPKAILEGAIAWLRDRQALLPGITTLERLVAEGRQAADRRLWRALADPVGPEVAGALLALLDVPEGNDKRRRVSELERLRRGVFRSSSKGMVAALRRLGDIEAVGAARLDVSAVPPRRLLALATHGMSGKATLLRRLPLEHKLAVLVATLLTVKSKLPASYLDARQVNHDLITGGWQRLVSAPGRPDGTVDRAAYVFCLLEQFHRHIKHRNIFATASSRWRDPRAHLLSARHGIPPAGRG